MLKGLKPLDFATNRKKVAVLLAERLEITWFATNRKKVESRRRNAPAMITYYLQTEILLKESYQSCDNALLLLDSVSSAESWHRRHDLIDLRACGP